MKSLVIALSMLLYGTAHASNIVYLNCDGFAYPPSPLALPNPHPSKLKNANNTIVNDMKFNINLTDKTVEWTLDSLHYREPLHLQFLTQIKTLTDSHIYSVREDHESIDINRMSGDITIHITPNIVLWRSDNCKVVKPLF
jgi:hypothetical protein